MKKGFTLIELLAVIVILAIIAVIAVPIVLNIIDETKNNTTLRSAEFYMDALELATAQSVLKNESIHDGTYNLKDGDICLNTACSDKIEVEVTGEKPSGTLIVDSGKIYSLTLKYKNKTISKYKDGELSYVTHKPGDVVYFNVKDGVGCTEEDYKKSWDSSTQDYLNSQVGYTGITNSCLKFYVIKDLGGALNLLLDHDLGMVPWAHESDYGCGSELCTKNDKGPLTLLLNLKNITNEWNGTEKPLNYLLNQKGRVSNANYTIDYTGYKARLITAQEIAEITGNINWDDSISTTTYYFDSLTAAPSASCTQGNIEGCKYGWLYDRTNENCEKYGCLNTSFGIWVGYFTATADPSTTNSAWFVKYDGKLESTLTTFTIGVQIRPVITITKDKLK